MSLSPHIYLISKRNIGHTTMKIKVGQRIDPFTVETITGGTQLIPDPTRPLTHLQFRRFAGCPICNFHLHEFSKNVDRINGAGIREVVFFHSSRDEMLKYQEKLPFKTVADPDKTYYKRFGVEASWRAPMHPKAMWASVKGALLGKMSVTMENGPLGLPADILIDAQGMVVAVKYGTHAYDQWDVSQVLAMA